MLYYDSCYVWYIHNLCNDDENRVINCVIHLDEATPHMQIASVPIYEDEKGYHLAANDIVGDRNTYSRRQDDFYTTVGKPRGFAPQEKVEYIPEQVTDKNGNIKTVLHRTKASKVHLTTTQYKLKMQAEENKKLEQENERLKTTAIKGKKAIAILKEQAVSAAHERDNAVAERNKAIEEVNRVKEEQQKMIEENNRIADLVEENRTALNYYNREWKKKGVSEHEVEGIIARSQLADAEINNPRDIDFSRAVWGDDEYGDDGR